MSHKTLLSLAAAIIVGTGTGFREASSRGCGQTDMRSCRGLPTAHATTPSVRRYARRPLPLLPGEGTGCYGFDHGPFYSANRCNFSYPCEYYGTCASGRPWKGTLSR